MTTSAATSGALQQIKQDRERENGWRDTGAFAKQAAASNIECVRCSRHTHQAYIIVKKIYARKPPTW